MEVFSLIHCMEYAGTTVILACLFLLCSYKPLAMLQQCEYKAKRTFSWYCRKDNMLFQRFSLLFLMLFLTSGLLGISFALFGAENAARISLLPYIVFCPLFFVFDKKYALKVPAKFTPRLKRLGVVYFLLLGIFIYLVVIACNVVSYFAALPLVTLWKYIPLSVMPMLLIFIAFAANGITGVFERAHNKKYIEKAKQKLSSSSCIKIGITGSFAKTTVKNILSAMLQEKYSVLATPSSYNTPMGIAKTVNEYEGDLPQVFIAEMGARKEGDINELCSIVPPDYSLITGVCGQHLQTFKSVENVLKTKAEIVAPTKKVTFAYKDEYTKELEGVTFVDESAYKDVVCSKDGTEFTLCLGTEVRVKTKLLGEHTAKNIALAAAVAKELKVSDKQIASAIEKLDYIPHRLQVIYGQNGVTVIDDGYNANVNGAKYAVEALKLFGGRKIVVTPGIVELGVLEVEENKKLGALLTQADQVILVGDTLVGAVKEGYLSAGGNAENISTEFTLQDAQKALAKILKKGDTVLFLNDLPDSY